MHHGKPWKLPKYISPTTTVTMSRFSLFEFSDTRQHICHHVCIDSRCVYQLLPGTHSLVKLRNMKTFKCRDIRGHQSKTYFGGFYEQKTTRACKTILVWYRRAPSCANWFAFRKAAGRKQPQNHILTAPLTKSGICDGDPEGCA